MHLFFQITACNIRFGPYTEQDFLLRSNPFSSIIFHLSSSFSYEVDGSLIIVKIYCIIASQDEEKATATASGSVQHVITDEERKTFKLGDKNLKDAVNSYFGKSPNDAFLHSPTPWDDLYKKYDWAQVKLVLVAQGAEILGITSNPEIVKTQEFDNNSSKKGTFNVGISQSVSNTSSSSWNTGGALSISQNISYGIKFLGTGVEGETSMSYSQSWGIGGQESESVTIGSTSGVSVELAPQESVVAKLTASRGVMNVRVKYNAYLVGQTAINYNPTYKGHHFWALDIGQVMAKDNIVNSIKSTEDIEIGFYSNAKVELTDKKTGNLKSAHVLADAAA